jgi:hypothetical protein
MDQRHSDGEGGGDRQVRKDVRREGALLGLRLGDKMLAGL